MAIKRARNPPSTTSQQPPSKGRRSQQHLPLTCSMSLQIVVPCARNGACPCQQQTLVTFNTDKGLVFLDDKLRSSIIDLALGENASVSGVLASTNGLLCFYCSELNEKFLYICNPTTREGDRIPLPPVSFRYSLNSIRLVFDPASSRHHYALVHPMYKPERGVVGVRYRFMVFSSDRREWIESDQMVDMEHNTITWTWAERGGGMWGQLPPLTCKTTCIYCL